MPLCCSWKILGLTGRQSDLIVFSKREAAKGCEGNFHIHPFKKILTSFKYCSQSDAVWVLVKYNQYFQHRHCISSAGTLAFPHAQNQQVEVRFLYCWIRGTRHSGSPVWSKKGWSRSSCAVALSRGSRVNIRSKKSLRTGEVLWEFFSLGGELSRSLFIAWTGESLK